PFSPFSQDINSIFADQIACRLQNQGFWPKKRDSVLPDAEKAFDLRTEMSVYGLLVCPPMGSLPPIPWRKDQSIRFRYSMYLIILFPILQTSLRYNTSSTPVPPPTPSSCVHKAKFSENVNLGYIIKD